MKLKSAIEKLRSVAKDAQVVYTGFKTLKRTKRTPEKSYLAMRNLFVATNGRSNDIISRLISNSRYNDLRYEGVLGLKTKNDVEAVITDIQKNGYHVFDQTLPDEMISEIFQYASETPSRYITNKGGFSDEPVLFDEKNPLSPPVSVQPGSNSEK